MKQIHRLCLAACVLVAMPSSAHTDDTRTIAIFRCEMFDTSGASNPIQKAQEEKRLDRVTQLITEGYDKDARYTTIDGAQASTVDSPYARLAQDGIISTCNGCEAKLARAINATHSLGCLVHKVSNLIMSITVYMRDANTEQLLEQHSADLRGNSDQSWERTALWLLKNRIFEDPKLRDARHRRMRGER